MRPSHTTGLGELGYSGKRSLFIPPQQPPKPSEPSSPTENKHIRQKKSSVKPHVKRIRTTLDLTPQALTVLQNLQHSYRLRTGRALPSWKVISQALEAYAKSAS